MPTRKFYLPEDKAPKMWYNIAADLPVALPPVLHPATLQNISPADLEPLFPMEVILQEVSTERYIEIPTPVLQAYNTWRPSPLIRATNLEKLLDTPARIYYKNEGTSPAGSHKPNTAIPQAFYNKEQGVKRLTTETGAGQWGSSLAFAGSLFGLEIEVFMVKISYNQKPYRRALIESFGGSVVASPSILTASGRKILEADPDSPGSLGIAISEAVELAVQREDTKYSLGSVLNHVLMHQSIIGNEALLQFDLANDYPDIVIGCAGGGSNVAGFTFPFIGEMLRGGKKVRTIAVEPAACPTLTKGIYTYDFGDTAHLTPLVKMHTLGSEFIPPSIHSGGLRYHGMAPMVSHLKELNLIEAVAHQQSECFKAGLMFAKSEGIIPAPESSHAIAEVIRQALICKEEGSSKTIAFNLSGHGHFDMQSYSDFISGRMLESDINENELNKSIELIPEVNLK